MHPHPRDVIGRELMMWIWHLRRTFLDVIMLSLFWTVLIVLVHMHPERQCSTLLFFCAATFYGTYQ